MPEAGEHCSKIGKDFKGRHLSARGQLTSLKSPEAFHFVLAHLRRSDEYVDIIEQSSRMKRRKQTSQTISKTGDRNGTGFNSSKSVDSVWLSITYDVSLKNRTKIVKERNESEKENPYALLLYLLSTCSRQEVLKTSALEGLLARWLLTMEEPLVEQ
jgi:hypothetical protein